MEEIDMDKFVKERNAALLSLDRRKIEKYAAKYGVKLPSDDKDFWAGIHKARLEIESLSDKDKEISRHWLMENGFKTFNGENQWN